MSEELDDARRRLVQHPGYERHLDLTAFALSLTEVFRANFAELHALLERATTDPMLALELVQNAHDDAVRREFQARTSQRLHNYLASTMSLVDHSRRLLRDVARPLLDEVNERKALLTANLEVPFMMDLRVFTQHRLLPELFHRVQISGPNLSTIDSEVGLGIYALLKWDKWSSASRQLLGKFKDSIPLLPVARRHADLVYDFNCWLHETLADDNAPALAEVNQLVIAANAVLIGGSIEDAEAYTEMRMAQRLEPRPQTLRGQT